MAWLVPRHVVLEPILQPMLLSCVMNFGMAVLNLFLTASIVPLVVTLMSSTKVRIWEYNELCVIHCWCACIIASMSNILAKVVD